MQTLQLSLSSLLGTHHGLFLSAMDKSKRSEAEFKSRQASATAPNQIRNVLVGFPPRGFIVLMTASTMQS
jgi:hypothetical protein